MNAGSCGYPAVVAAARPVEQAPLALARVCDCGRQAAEPLDRRSGGGRRVVGQLVQDGAHRGQPGFQRICVPAGDQQVPAAVRRTRGDLVADAGQGGAGLSPREPRGQDRRWMPSGLRTAEQADRSIARRQRACGQDEPGWRADQASSQPATWSARRHRQAVLPYRSGHAAADRAPATPGHRPSSVSHQLVGRGQRRRLRGVRGARFRCTGRRARGRPSGRAAGGRGDRGTRCRSRCRAGAAAPPRRATGTSSRLIASPCCHHCAHQRYSPPRVRRNMGRK